MIKVVKFGGTSMANASAIIASGNVVKSCKDRRYVIVSAPGKRENEDIKVTDLLYRCYQEKQVSGSCEKMFEQVKKRFFDIVNDLKLDIDIDIYLNATYKQMQIENTPEFFASRGEYLSAIVMAHYLGYTFIDSKDIIVFNADGKFMAEETNIKVKNKLKKHKYAVIPGFYGSDGYSNIKTFSRGGSDITGAVISRAVEADIYENWTDVNGFMSADPRIVKNPRPIESLTYRELRELSYMGANVLHPESIFPVQFNNIPINIKNTFEPENSGTFIIREYEEDKFPTSTITGIAGKKGYSIIYIEKSMMNSEIGFVRKVLSVCEQFNVVIEHLPTGIDTICLVVPDDSIEGKQDDVIKLIKASVSPDKIEMITDISMIATVGQGMAAKVGTASIIFKALAEQNINIRMIDQGSSELNIIVGVDTKDYEKSINSIYSAFNN